MSEPDTSLLRQTGLLKECTNAAFPFLMPKHGEAYCDVYTVTFKCGAVREITHDDIELLNRMREHELNLVKNLEMPILLVEHPTTVIMRLTRWLRLIHDRE